METTICAACTPEVRGTDIFSGHSHSVSTIRPASGMTSMPRLSTGRLSEVMMYSTAMTQATSEKAGVSARFSPLACHRLVYSSAACSTTAPSPRASMPVLTIPVTTSPRTRRRPSSTPTLR